MQDIASKLNGDFVQDFEFNQPISEIENAILSSGISLSGADLNQLAKAIANYVSSANFYIDTGTADNYVLNTTGSFKPATAYFNGMLIRFRAVNANTGISTINVSSLGIKNIKKSDGVTDLSAGDISATKDTLLRYNGTDFVLFSIGTLEVDKLIGDLGNSTATTHASSDDSTKIATTKFVRDIFRDNDLLSENGYTTLPNGLIIQWQKHTFTTTAGTQTLNITLPIAFPNNYFSSVVSYNASIADLNKIGGDPLSLTQTQVSISNNVAGVSRNFFIFAIGN